MWKTFMWRFFEVKLTSGRWVHFRFLLNVFLLSKSNFELSVQSIVEKSTNDKKQKTLYLHNIMSYTRLHRNTNLQLNWVLIQLVNRESSMNKSWLKTQQSSARNSPTLSLPADSERSTKSTRIWKRSSSNVCRNASCVKNSKKVEVL